MANKIKSHKGYGTVSHSVLSNRNISIEAKALYAYYMSHINDSVIPSAAETCYDLKISYRKFKGLRKQLFERGIL
ncbi:hypothetical protein [Staphylococcus epidermidis]|uniref:hypothetical protein n=1 Tax=Staphylococcus epidermidis TaxID=1282 RepID=UPI00050913F3|nr:hypothetical protein [Staphylococcus epidermidis]AIR82549.1 hypothetical protein DP17_1474 [Staphylococcus epidermidis]